MTDETQKKKEKKAKPRAAGTTAKAKTKKEPGEKSTAKKVTHDFRAETKELLNIMINSLYTHREIFLRELISNSSDAIDKINFRSLTEPELLEDDPEFKIILGVDKDAKTFTISDNGIGMTYKEVIQNIGTIARSGSKSFIESIKDKDEVDLIGKFGVGFYSAFMVAERVVVTTRPAGTTEGSLWESTGDGTFTIEHVPVEKRGTEIVLHLRKEAYEASEPEEDFLNQYTIQNLVKKYSDYIAYPIEMNFTREQPVKDIEGFVKLTVVQVKIAQQEIDVFLIRILIQNVFIDRFGLIQFLAILVDVPQHQERRNVTGRIF